VIWYARVGGAAAIGRLDSFVFIVPGRDPIALDGIDTAAMSDEDIQAIAADRARSFRDEAPTTAAEAAKIILDGVKEDRWRILVGEDAKKIDEWVRRTPEQAYDVDFFERFATEAGWKIAR